MGQSQVPIGTLVSVLDFSISDTSRHVYSEYLAKYYLRGSYDTAVFQVSVKRLSNADWAIRTAFE